MRSEMHRLYRVWFHLNRLAVAKEEELEMAVDRHLHRRASVPSGQLILCASELRLLADAIAVAALRLGVRLMVRK
jgi:hypothetical protein